MVNARADPPSDHQDFRIDQLSGVWEPSGLFSSIRPSDQHQKLRSWSLRKPVILVEGAHQRRSWPSLFFPVRSFFFPSLPSSDPNARGKTGDHAPSRESKRKRARGIERWKKRERSIRDAYYVYSIEPDILWCHPRQTVLFATGQEGNSLTFCQLDRDNGKQVEECIRRSRVTLEEKLLLFDMSVIFGLHAFG